MRRELLRAAASLGIFLILVVAVGLFAARSQPTAAPAPTAAEPEPFVGDIIVPPKPAPDFDLTDYSGARVSLKDLRGKLVLLSFAYTSCPDVCPLLARGFVGVQKELGETVGRDIALIFISVDPQGDTPERRQSWTESQGGRWYFLSGELTQLAKVWKDYRVYVEKRGAFVDHSAITYLIDRNGLIRLRYGGIPPSKAFVADLRSLLGE